MNETPVEQPPLALPPVGALRPARLSIADLLLITLGTGIAIWILQTPEYSGNVAYEIATVALAPVCATASAATLLAIFRDARRLAPFATQPGHWQLLQIGIAFGRGGIVVRFAPMIDQAPPIDLVTIMVPVGAVIVLLSLVLLLYLVIADGDQSPRWRRVFRLLAASLMLPFVGCCGIDPISIPGPIPIVLSIAWLL
jgi:hypothetical protein